MAARYKGERERLCYHATPCNSMRHNLISAYFNGLTAGVIDDGDLAESRDHTPISVDPPGFTTNLSSITVQKSNFISLHIFSYNLICLSRITSLLANPIIQSPR